MMRKKIVTFIISILAMVMIAGALAGCGSTGTTASSSDKMTVSKSLQHFREQGKIVIGGTATPPFSYVDPDTKKIAGIDGEISVAIANKLGIKDVEFKQVTFDNLLMELQNKNIDVASSAMYITDVRKKKAAFSNVYYKEGEGLLFKASKNYHSLDEIKGKGLICAVQNGSGYKKVADKLAADGYFKEIAIYPSINECILAVKSGNADFTMTDDVALAYAASKDANSDLALLKGYKPEYAGKIGAAFRKDDPQFVKEWNDALDGLKKDGTVMKILQKYGCGDDNFVNVEEGQTSN